LDRRGHHHYERRIDQVRELLEQENDDEAEDPFSCQQRDYSEFNMNDIQCVDHQNQILLFTQLPKVDHLKATDAHSFQDYFED